MIYRGSRKILESEFFPLKGGYHSAKFFWPEWGTGWRWWGVGVICGFPKMKVALLFNLKSTDHLARSVINDLDDLLIENE